MYPSSLFYFLKAQPFARQLLENSQGGQFKELQAFPGKSPQDHTLAEIVIHTSVALQCVGSGSLAQPLCILMANPSAMTVFIYILMVFNQSPENQLTRHDSHAGGTIKRRLGEIFCLCPSAGRR